MCGGRYSLLDNSGQCELKGAGGVKKVGNGTACAGEAHAERVCRQGRWNGPQVACCSWRYALASSSWPIHKDAKSAEKLQNKRQGSGPAGYPTNQKIAAPKRSSNIHESAGYPTNQ